MKPPVRAVFREYSESLEGRTRWLYSDTKKLLTVSVGCLVDPIHLAMRLPWMIGDRPATQAEIRNDWQSLKARAGEVCSWLASKQAPLTTIRLTDTGVDALLQSRITANVSYLRRLFPGWNSFPCDAQLAILSTAWALGAGFDITKPPRTEFIAACNAQDWLAAAPLSHIEERGNKGVVKRNERHRLCFQNAATVKECALSPDELWWPNVTPRTQTLEEILIVGEVPKPDGSP